MTETIPAQLLAAAEAGDPTAGIRFLDRRERPTFYDFPTVVDRAQRVAGALHALGVRAGHRVAVVLPTCPGFTDCFFAIQMLGAVPVALYPPVRLGRLDEYFARTANMLSRVEADLVVSEPRIRRLLGKVFATYSPPLGVHDVDPLLDGTPHAQVDVGPDDLGLVQFSSGTTVAPKPVGLTHRQLLANARRITDVILERDPMGGDVAPGGVSWLPLYHDMGLIGAILPAVIAPGPITLIAPEVFLAKPAVWLRAMSTYKATISPAPDFAYALCLERIKDADLEGVDLSSWHLALDGAEPISADTLRAFGDRFQRWGFDPSALMPVYGLSEAALAVTFSDARAPFHAARFSADELAGGRAVPSDDGVELVSVGTPLPDYAIRIVDAEGTEVPPGTIGQIEAQGPSLMRGYLDREEQPFRDGWLMTGDLGFVDDGQLFVTGRAKDVIILRGRNHAPHDIERVVDDIEGVRRGCAAAVADVGEHGERLLVFVEVRTAVEGQADAATRAIKAAIGVAPDLLVLLEPGTLPRTSSGKIRRAETLRRWRAGELTPPDAVTPLRIAGAYARSALAWLSRR